MWRMVLGALVFLLSFFGVVNNASSYIVYFYVDSAPNDASYSSWENDTFSAVANGTFLNMSNGKNPNNIGTTNFAIEDEVVYSFGDYGRRLHWIYWVPGATTSKLDGKFEASLINYWDGYMWDAYGYLTGSTWLRPTAWQDYDKDSDGSIDGVIGTGGMAWWGGYPENTQEALNQDLKNWALVNESWVFTVRISNDEDYDYYQIVSNRAAIPEPSTLLLLGSGLVSIAGMRRRAKR